MSTETGEIQTAEQAKPPVANNDWSALLETELANNKSRAGEIAKQVVALITKYADWAGTIENILPDFGDDENKIDEDTAAGKPGIVDKREYDTAKIDDADLDHLPIFVKPKSFVRDFVFPYLNAVLSHGVWIFPGIYTHTQEWVIEEAGHEYGRHRSIERVTVIIDSFHDIAVAYSAGEFLYRVQVPSGGFFADLRSGSMEGSFSEEARIYVSDGNPKSAIFFDNRDILDRARRIYGKVTNAIAFAGRIFSVFKKKTVA